jgi:hypothetical protein
MTCFNRFTVQMTWVTFVALISVNTISTPTSAQTQEQLNTCKDVVTELAGVPSSIMKVSNGKTNGDGARVDIRVTKPWKLPDTGGTATATDRIGNCDFDSLGKLIKIDTFVYSAQSPRHFQDFGNIPNLGRFIVIIRFPKQPELMTVGRVGNNYVNSKTRLYYSTIGQDFDGKTSVFSVLLNGKKQRWWIDCNTDFIGKLNADGMKELPQRVPSTFANAMNKLVCVE